MKTRLNTTNRATLIAFAKGLIDCPAERLAEERAHADLLAALRAEAAALSTEEDLTVLRKYGCVSRVTTAYLDEPHGNGHRDVAFCLCPRDVRDPAASRNTNGCHHTVENCPEWIDLPGKHYRFQIVGGDPIGDRLRPLFRAFRDACDAHDAAREAILRDVRAVVAEARTYEGLVELWPAAKGAADLLGAVPAVDEPMVARLARLRAVGAA